MSPFLKIIDEKLLPWARDPEKQRLILMGSPSAESEIPEGVRFSKRLPTSPRRVINPNRLGQWHGYSAKWPKDGLIERAGVPVVVCVFEGLVDFWAGDLVAHCGAGHYLLIPPGLRHDGGKRPHYDYDPDRPSPDDHCSLLWIERNGRITQISTCHCKGDHHGSEPATSVHVLNDAAGQILDFMMAEAMSRDPGWQSVCREYLTTILVLLRRELVRGAILSSSRNQGAEFASQPSHDPIEQAISYIRGNLRKPLTIDSVAHHVCLARTQFTRQFRQKTGVSFARYLAECRIEKAKTLLTSSNWSHTRIGEVVGLRSASYFCRFFVKNVGVSPRVYRKNASGGPPAKRPRAQKADVSI